MQYQSVLSFKLIIGKGILSANPIDNEIIYSTSLNKIFPWISNPINTLSHSYRRLLVTGKDCQIRVLSLPLHETCTPYRTCVFHADSGGGGDDVNEEQENTGVEKKRKRVSISNRFFLHLLIIFYLSLQILCYSVTMYIYIIIHVHS